MAISASSSVDDIRAQYLDNLDYDDTNSVTKARLFKAACRGILGTRPTGSGSDRSNVQFDNNVIQEQLLQVAGWLSQRGDTGATTETGGGSRHFSLGNLRDQGAGYNDNCGGNC